MFFCDKEALLFHRKQKKDGGKCKKTHFATIFIFVKRENQDGLLYYSVGTKSDIINR